MEGRSGRGRKDPTPSEDACVDWSRRRWLEVLFSQVWLLHNNSIFDLSCFGPSAHSYHCCPCRLVIKQFVLQIVLGAETFDLFEE